MVSVSEISLHVLSDSPGDCDTIIMLFVGIRACVSLQNMSSQSEYSLSLIHI